MCSSDLEVAMTDRMGRCGDVSDHIGKPFRVAVHVDQTGVQFDLIVTLRVLALFKKEEEFMNTYGGCYIL